MVSFSRRGRRWPGGNGGAGGASNVTVPRGQLLLTGFAPQATLVQPRSGGLTLTGHPPLPHMTSVTIGLGELALAGPAPSANVAMLIGLGQLSLIGFEPNINDVLKPPTGMLSLTGPVPVAVADQVAQPGAGALTLTGPAPTVDAGETGVTSLSEFATARSNTESLTLPANIAEGDVILFLNRSSGFGSVGTGVPTDFTSIDIRSPSGTQAQQLSYKIAAGTEGGTSINGLTGSGNDFRNTCLVIRGNNPITSVNVLDVDGAESNSAPSDQTITSGAGSAPLAVVAGFGSSGPYTPSFSTTADSDVRTDDGDEEGILMAKYYDSSPANTVVGMTDGGSFNCLQSCYIECS